MKKSSKKKIEEFIRVDHAGERGAIKIYEGQLLALNTVVKDDAMKKTIEEMREHEREHADYFEKEIKNSLISYYLFDLAPNTFALFVDFFPSLEFIAEGQENNEITT